MTVPFPGSDQPKIQENLETRVQRREKLSLLWKTKRDVPAFGSRTLLFRARAGAGAGDRECEIYEYRLFGRIDLLLNGGDDAVFLTTGHASAPWPYHKGRESSRATRESQKLLKR